LREPNEPPFIPYSPPVRYELVVGMHTQTRITDIEAYVQTLDWPESIGPVNADTVKPGTSTPLADGGFLTRFQLDLPQDVAVARRIGTWNLTLRHQVPRPSIRKLSRLFRAR
jgi:hypothetical protein